MRLETIRLPARTYKITVAAILLLALTAMTLFAAPIKAQTPAPMQATLLSAFYGLDNALPVVIVRWCRRGANQDGMPVIFSAVIDPKTLDAQDFAVTTASGKVYTPLCAILDPATDLGELRTVLLVGQLGDAKTDPPVRVTIVQEILTSANTQKNPDAADANSLNFKGASVEVTPLSAGPSLVLAEIVPQWQWTLNRRSGQQVGSGCPANGTVQIVRVVWAGGVTTSSRDEAGESERKLYRVTLKQDDGPTKEVTPFALADLGDGDNNHLLCLDAVGQPTEVFFPAGYLYDPNHDVPNPDTTISVSG